MSARAEAAMRGGLLPRASEELEEKEQEFASKRPLKNLVTGDAKIGQYLMHLCS